MQRHELLALMGELKLRGMVAAFDEAVVQGLRLHRRVEEILGDLLRAEAAERRSRSIRYRLGVAGLPVMKDLESFRFEESPVNAALVRSLHDGTFLATQRNVVLVGGTGTASWCPSRYHPIEPEHFAADRQTADGAGDEHRRFA